MGTASGTAPGAATGTSSGAATGTPGDATTAAFPRTVAHAMGETTIPEQPQRVVVLDTGELDSAIALGVVPVGAVRAPVEDGLLDYLRPQTEGATQLVGTISEPDLEAIAALRPDLILSSKLRHEDLYDQLGQVTSTVFSEAVGVVWKENFLLHGEALGYREEAERMLADYEARASELGERLREELGGLPTVSIVRFLPGETRLYQRASFIGTVLEDVGLPRPAPQDVDDFALVISEEQIHLADGELIFVTWYGPAEDTTRASFTSNPLWERLEGVQAGHVHEAPDDTWMLGIGIGAANVVLDDLERILLTE
ncbi:MAG: ABC transporter substrate-binding protein [Dehalococcoidia bacterium]|nr:ABC transporter substrate-binding protein [Dehalococcoidia bacterium]